MSKRVSAEAERNVLVWRAMRAASYRIPVEVNGVDRGHIVGVVGGHNTAREPQDGGSTRIVRFDDGSAMPAEELRSIERAA